MSDLKKEKSLKTLHFVGPLPPPVNGFSVVTKCMLQVFDENFKVKVFDLTSNKSFHALLIDLLFYMVRTIRGGGVTYVALSGGLRQWIDLIFIAVGSFFGEGVYVHHHSFGYINRVRNSMWIIAKINRNVKHIALCDGMAKALSVRYRIADSHILVISNAATTSYNEYARFASGANVITVGFISNITREKGIFEYFSILRECSARGMALRGLVAGMPSGEIEDCFNAELRAETNIGHVGAVSGEKKKEFFENIDVLLFPTKYANEAEPLVLLEALSYGIPVIAADRGCIASIVPLKAGRVIKLDDGFERAVVGILEYWLSNPEVFDSMRIGAKAAFMEISNEQKNNLNALIHEMNLSNR